VVGIVTISDLIERLVGEFTDDDDEESANEDPRIEQLDQNTWAIFGNVELSEIEETLKVSIGLEEVDTLTGLVFNELGVILSDGECDIELEYEGLQIHITSIDEHQIAKAEITVVERPDEPLEE